MNTKAFIHKMLMDCMPKDGGYDIKTIIFASLPWPDFEECRVVLADGSIIAAIFEDGDRITPFVELPKEQK